MPSIVSPSIAGSAGFGQSCSQTGNSVSEADLQLLQQIWIGDEDKLDRSALDDKHCSCQVATTAAVAAAIKLDSAD
jgi:hypothetical protein